MSGVILDHQDKWMKVLIVWNISTVNDRGDDRSEVRVSGTQGEKLRE